VGNDGGSKVVEALRFPSALVSPYLLLLVAEAPSHGYEIVTRLNEISEAAAGSVYRELRQLEEAGYIASTWSHDQLRGPARRVYSITPAGRRALRLCIDATARLAESLGEFEDRASQLSRVRSR
jgi:PadR family transcriptional regulator, regulatory protein PadR